MITFNQTPGYDKDIVWIFRVNLDTEYLYFSTAENGVTLSGTNFDGKVIRMGDDRYPAISNLDKSMDVMSGGGIGTVGNLTFEIARYTSYDNGTTYDDFFNDWYPATGKPLLTGKRVDVGICWTGATLTSEITYFWAGYVDDYSWNDHALIFLCLEYAELPTTQVPAYVVQDDIDNGISYYPDASEDQIEQVIPIVYGDFSTYTPKYSTYSLSPSVRVHNTDFYFKIASHECYGVTTFKYMYRYLDKPQRYMLLTDAGAGGVGSIANTRAGYDVRLSVDGSRVSGDYRPQPLTTTDFDSSVATGGDAFEYSTLGDDPTNAYDKSSTTYATIDSSELLAFQLGSDLSNGEFGALDGANANCKFIVEWDAVGGSVDYIIKLYHPNLVSDSGYHTLETTGTTSGTGNTTFYDFGEGNAFWGVNPTKRENTPNWSIEELQEVQIHVINESTSTGDMRIKNVYFAFGNIVILGSTIPTKKVRSPWQVITISGPAQVFDVGAADNKIFGYVQGYMFDRWIL